MPEQIVVLPDRPVVGNRRYDTFFHKPKLFSAVKLQFFYHIRKTENEQVAVKAHNTDTL